MMESALLEQQIFYRRNLPHWYVCAGTYFLTWRLAGSIPVTEIEIIRERSCKRQLSNGHVNLEKDYFFSEYDSLLDMSSRIRYLADDRIALICANALIFYDSKEYNLDAYCIMSNHVHAVVTRHNNSCPLNKIMQSIKRFSARESNKILGRVGPFWQEETYDHLVRNEQDFQRVVHYTIENPVKAGLVNDWKKWKWTYLDPKFKLVGVRSEKSSPDLQSGF